MANQLGKLTEAPVEVARWLTCGDPWMVMLAPVVASPLTLSVAVIVRCPPVVASAVTSLHARFSARKEEPVVTSALALSQLPSIVSVEPVVEDLSLIHI